MQLLKYSLYYFKRVLNLQAILISILIIINILLLYQYVTTKNFSMTGTFIDVFILNNIDNLGLMILIFVIPFIAASIFGDIGINQKKLESFIEIKVPLKKLYYVNTITSFISGFLIMLMFLSFLFFFTYITFLNKSDIYWADSLNIANDVNQIISSLHFPFLLINFPFIRSVVYIIFFATYMGIISALSYAIGLYFSNKYYVYIIPFFIEMVIMISSNIFGSPIYFQRMINPQSVQVHATYIGLIILPCLYVIFIYALVYMKIRLREKYD